MTPTLYLGQGLRRSLVVGLACVATIFATAAVCAKLETWRVDTAASFNKTKRDRLVVSDTGRVQLAHGLKSLGTLDASRVWDLARTSQGVLYAATGDEGKVFRREAAEDAAWVLDHDATDTQALSLVVGPEGHVFLGTGPSGEVVDLTDPKHPASRPHPDVKYIWDLAADSKGNLYAATGPTGQLWKRSVEGAWSLLHDSAHSHLLCVAVGPDDSVYAGSDGEGLIYKVAPTGKVSVLYDAPQSEIRAIVVSADGMVFAGTAAEAGGGSSRGNPVFSSGSNASASNSAPAQDTGRSLASTPAATADDPPKKDETPKKADTRARSGPTAGGSAAPKPPSPGDNAVYRIDTDGVAREVFRAKVLVFALALRDDKVMIGTGPDGQLYEVSEDGREAAPIARLDNGQILALLQSPDGKLLIGTGDPGAVARFESGHVESGTLTSEVRDTKLISRFGALSWRAETPRNTSIHVQVRSGNVAEPDATWSDWGAEQSNPESARADAPAGRFVQFRVKLATTDPAVSPSLHALSLRYQTANLPPEIAKLEVPDLSTLDGASRQTRLTIRWDVGDPNDDELNYTLHVRKEGWPDWVKLTETPVTDKSLNWDTTTVPNGLYRVRLTASDRPSNNATDVLTQQRVSETFIVDHDPPAVAIKVETGKATAVLRDQLTRIVKAAYALDGGEWIPVFAEDNLFDTLVETVVIPLPDLKPGTHILVVRATDAAGNLGTADALIEAR